MFQIMVVDDDRNTRRLLQAVLEADGYKVLTAENGEDALALMDLEYVDLVVLDIMMPQMDGYEFTRTLRETNNNLRLYFPERQGEEHCPGPKYLLMAIAGPGILRDLCPENNETGIFGHCIVCIVNVCV